MLAVPVSLMPSLFSVTPSTQTTLRSSSVS